MGIKICPDCGGKVSESRNDCPHCGYIFRNKITCPDCNEEIDDNLKECPVCGRALALEIESENIPNYLFR